MEEDICPKRARRGAVAYSGNSSVGPERSCSAVVNRCLSNAACSTAASFSIARRLLVSSRSRLALISRVMTGMSVPDVENV